MKILFLCSGGGSCRSLIAKAIMQSFDDKLEVYAAGLNELNCTVDKLLSVLSDSGYELDQTKQYSTSEINSIEFDYLITLCDGTKEEFYKLPLIFKHKLHLGFTDPESILTGPTNEEDNYKEIIEEIYTELSYFYHRILKKTASD